MGMQPLRGCASCRNYGQRHFFEVSMPPGRENHRHPLALQGFLRVCRAPSPRGIFLLHWGMHLAPPDLMQAPQLVDGCDEAPNKCPEPLSIRGAVGNRLRCVGWRSPAAGAGAQGCLQKRRAASAARCIAVFVLYQTPGSSATGSMASGDSVKAPVSGSSFTSTCT